MESVEKVVPQVIVDPQANLQLVRVGNLISGDQCGSQWSESMPAFFPRKTPP